jgi:hypothetical protein
VQNKISFALQAIGFNHAGLGAFALYKGDVANLPKLATITSPTSRESERTEIFQQYVHSCKNDTKSVSIVNHGTMNINIVIN